MREIRGGSSITRIVACTDCKGEKTCEICKGTGMVKIKKQVFTTITIESHKAKQLEV